MTHQELLEKYLNNLSSNVDDINTTNFLEDVCVEEEEGIGEEGITEGATILHIPDLSRFKNMVNLNVSTCNIASLPSLILLEKLEIFTCCYNSLRSLPELNKGLKVLRCSWNLLECLPTLADAPFLKKLDCSYNKISSIDISLNPHLKEVDCSQNNISCMDISLNYTTTFTQIIP
jgi:Leucine-rich repeat (LRR) protein